MGWAQDERLPLFDRLRLQNLSADAPLAACKELLAYASRKIRPPEERQDE